MKQCQIQHSSGLDLLYADKLKVNRGGGESKSQEAQQSCSLCRSFNLSRLAAFIFTAKRCCRAFFFKPPIVSIFQGSSALSSCV